MSDFLTWAFELIQQHGLPLYIPLYLLASLAVVPGMPMALLGGFLYGPFTGFLVLYGTSLAASLLAFGIGRVLHALPVTKRAHTVIHRWTGLLDTGDSFRALTLLYASPFTPFRSLSYAMGASALKAQTFFYVLAIALVPHMLPYAIFGSLASELSQLLNGDAGFQSHWVSITNFIIMPVLTLLLVGLPIYLRKRKKPRT